jgi:hypothetical protein
MIFAVESLKGPLEAFTGRAVALELAGGQVRPHVSELLSLAMKEAEQVARAISECGAFVTIRDRLAPESVVTLARVIAVEPRPERLVLAVVGICRAELLEADVPNGGIHAVRPILDQHPAVPTVHRENRRYELLEWATSAADLALPPAVVANVLDHATLGVMSDLIDPSGICDEADVDARSDEVLNWLRERVSARRTDGLRDGFGFSAN